MTFLRPLAQVMHELSSRYHCRLPSEAVTRAMENYGENVSPQRRRERRRGEIRPTPLKLDVKLTAAEKHGFGK